MYIKSFHILLPFYIFIIMTSELVANTILLLMKFKKYMYYLLFNV